MMDSARQLDGQEEKTKEGPRFLPATADKEDNLNYDLGNLTVFDPEPVNLKVKRGKIPTSFIFVRIWKKMSRDI